MFICTELIEETGRPLGLIFGMWGSGHYLGARDAPLGARFLRNFSLGVLKFGQLPIDLIQNHGFRRVKFGGN